ncbi:MAG TPA: ATP-binding cassette domain-containing protein [Polyangiaceae bacterium]|nr:ATP-binding cassette domain-containing protein [Polyangiaceae bacterium]
MHRALFSGFVIAATLHGIGHGLMAMAAALLGTAFVEHSSPGPSLFGIASPETLALVGVVAALAKGAGAIVGATLQSRLAQKVAGWVRRDVAARLLAGGSVLPDGQLAARLSVGLRDVERGVEEGFLGALRAGLALAPLAVALALVSSQLVWAAVALLLLFAALLSLARKAWKRGYVRAALVAEGIHQEVDELVSHMDVWRVYGAAERVCRTLDDLAEDAARAASRAEGSRVALSSANEVLAALTLLACVAFARWFSLPLGDGTLIAFAVPFFMAYRPLRDLGDARTALERGAASLAMLEETARMPKTLPRAVAPTSPAATPDGPASRRWERARLDVGALGVARGEEGATRTSFTVSPGEIVAVVGPTGSGKTTLLRALLGLEPDATGSIRYGAEELVRTGVGPLARPFAWAPQDAPVLAGSLEENVLFLSADPRAVTDVLRSIGAGRLAQECAGVELGASGRSVSGGERKWIALARAIASGLPVLLLDEPTAGLDAAAQATMLQALQRLRATRSIVLVTHQRDAMRWADRVVAIGSNADDQNWAKNLGSFSNSNRMSGMS